MSQRKLAKELGIIPSRWNQWERGIHEPDVAAMVALKLEFDISLDWIFAGDLSLLPHHLAETIRAQADVSTAPVALRHLRHRRGKGREGTPL